MDIMQERCCNDIICINLVNRIESLNGKDLGLNNYKDIQKSKE
jgi:hypothetical protein